MPALSAGLDTQDASAKAGADALRQVAFAEEKAAKAGDLDEGASLTLKMIEPFDGLGNTIQQKGLAHLKG